MWNPLFIAFCMVPFLVDLEWWDRKIEIEETPVFFEYNLEYMLNYNINVYDRQKSYVTHIVVIF